MTVEGRLEGADPTDLAGLREALARADPEGKLAPIGMRRIEIGPDALALLPEVVSELVRGDREAPRVVLATDATPMRRKGGDPKAEAERLLAGGRFEVSRAVLGVGRAQLHADEEALAEARAVVADAECVVVVGSGTITDVCKEATVDGPPLVVVQTAASVNAFSDDVSVLLKSGTKRTVPTRWPDVLLVDLATLAGAPARFGDLDPPVAPEVARWALRNCHLMRNRFTLADLLFFADLWDDSFVERILERARSAGGGL